jgi:thymidylate synthase (FAD)
MSKIEVTYLDHMGTDLDVVNAARVSFKKASDWAITNDYGLPCVLSEPDKKLLRYLANHAHFSPFTHCYLKFHVKAPIFVARQLQKHRVGLSWWDDEDADSLSWNEVSRRYVDDEPEFFVPDYWRARADNVKQGSSGSAVDLKDKLWYSSRFSEFDDARSVLSNTLNDTVRIYDSMLCDCIAPEQARMVLPQSTMTEWIWSGSLFGFIRVCKQRLDGHTQRETQEVAKQIAPIIHQYCPYSYEALLS